ncbi:alanine racemase 1 [Abditibacteriota bacterium]|nr:alanine racemase 1 [Abditibacteriota bacterium]
MPFSRPTWAEVDLSALRHNVRVLAELAAPATLLAVCKANAYGHDVRLVAPVFDSMPEVAMLGVASVDEGMLLRKLGVQKPVLLLSAMLPEEARTAVRAHLTPTIWTRELGLSLQQAAEKERTRADFHFKVDTGMGRLGFRFEDAREAFCSLRDFDRLDLRGIYTHMANADEEDDDLTALQLHRFKGFLREVESPLEVTIHAGNSAATMRYPESRFDMVRPGIALYGSNPFPAFALDLKPVMTWKARVTSLKTIPVGASVSYGAQWTAPVATRVAVISAGYADGFRRSLSNRAHILINGKRCPVIGRVTMDQIMADVSGAMVHLGDEATLFGRGLPVEEMADNADTISYEILCGVSSRVPRLATSSG